MSDNYESISGCVRAAMGYFWRDDGMVSKNKYGPFTKGDYKVDGRYWCVGNKLVNGPYHLYVHRMVCALFCENPCPGLFDQVDHIDRDSHNNSSLNLRWLSHQLNHMNKKGKNVRKKRVRLPGGQYITRYIPQISSGTRKINADFINLPVWYCDEKEAIEVAKTLKVAWFDYNYFKAIKNYNEAWNARPSAERVARNIFEPCWTASI